jgi:hypothetical protein
MPACRSRAADPALRCADVSLEERDLKAIAPFVKVVRELDLYRGVNIGPARLAPPAALLEIAPASAPLRLLTRPAWLLRACLKTKKLRKRAVKLLKSSTRMNLCAR